MLTSIKRFFIRSNSEKDIGEPPYDYDLLINLEESSYPLYLSRMYESIMGEKLNLKSPKNFCEKIQWLKLYDNTTVKSRLTDKVLVRSWIEEKIGKEYLKPVLWFGKKFEEIPFDILPSKFIIKANHGCKWHYKIKDKEEFLKNEKLYNYIKLRFDGWMNQTFFPWGGFELQYKKIEPCIMIEPLLTEEKDSFPVEFEIYCFNGKPKIFQEINYSLPVKCCVYDENYNECEISFNSSYIKYFIPAKDLLKKAVELSAILAEEFKLVRVDWILYKNQIYFNEMTFTPFSGFFQFKKKAWNKKLGRMLKLH